jgi:hypothetical protein
VSKYIQASARINAAPHISYSRKVISIFLRLASALIRVITSKSSSSNFLTEFKENFSQLLSLKMASSPPGLPISPVHCTGASNYPIGSPNTSRASNSLTLIGQLEGLRPPIKQ